MRRIVIAMFIALAPAFPSWAQDDGAPSPAIDISGAWGLETTARFHDGDCRLDGDAEIALRPEGGYACELKVVQSCLTGRVIQTRQRCSAEQTGDRVRIVSEIESVDPEGWPYYADNFRLTILHAGRMDGVLDSIVSAPVTFFRRDGPVA